MNYKIEKTDINNDKVVKFLLKESLNLYLEINPKQIPIYLYDEKIRENIGILKQMYYNYIVLHFAT